MRRAARRDNIEALVVEALRKSGCSVQRLSAKGVPDLLVYYKDLRLLEIKGEDGVLTPDQIAWKTAWRGKVYICRTPMEALIAAGVVK